MLNIFEILPYKEPTETSLTLPFELRQKSRFKAQLNDGRDVGLKLPRGIVLRSGDCLRSEDGLVIRIEAADEQVSTVTDDDMHQIARCAYHLGNRHVSLQIGQGWLRYKHDHVLDEMVRGLGVNVGCEMAPFEPEAGAYSGHSHSDAQAPTQGKSQGKSQSHTHSDGTHHSHDH